MLDVTITVPAYMRARDSERDSVLRESLIDGLTVLYPRGQWAGVTDYCPSTVLSYR